MHRIKTDIGINKQINIKLEQDFDFLEILSLRISQQEIYNRNCAEYGVIVGRITANSGYGLENVKVSVFVPIREEDKNNPDITSIYPYASIEDINEDGYRYNLLPYQKSYSTHAATGTFPSRDDVLNDELVAEIYDKYYKYTVKTNSSGDYMIFGVPTGAQTVFVDIDLSDIGEFSLTPQDLIKMGLATENQVSGNRFKSSTNLNELPQIISLNKNIEVSPLWGQEEVCDVSINRVDFDLRADANVDIQPTAVFMGSIMSTSDDKRIRSNCKPKDDFGNLCSLEANTGQILAIRQTIFDDDNGNPILEEYRLENSGNVIDGDGTWLIDIPMNMDYVITNEEGEKIIVNDPKIGIPTKGKYRFKIKWQQSTSLTQQVRRAYFLVPNVREYWLNSTTDPNYELNENSLEYKTLSGSYYFGLDWSGYTNSDAAISCEDTFYEFTYNKIYSVASLIDNYKNGSGRGRFIGIKEIDDNSCSSIINKFPVNDGVRNFDLIYFVFSILFQVIQLIGVPILIAYHLIAFLWNNFAVPLLLLLITFFTASSVYFFLTAALMGFTPWVTPVFILLGLLSAGTATLLGSRFRRISSKKFGNIKLPMITYPDCQSCECEQEGISDGDTNYPNSLLTQFSNSALYYENINNNLIIYPDDIDNNNIVSAMIAEVIGTRTDDKKNIAFYKSTESREYRLPSNAKKIFGYSTDLPLAERINVFNGRKKYFDNQNKIRVTFNKPANVGKFHYDNTLTVLMQDKLDTGTLLTFVNPESSQDVNYKFTGGTFVNGISGITINKNNVNINVKYAISENSESNVSYLINNQTDNTNYRFASDIEYYQVVTAITVSEAVKIWNSDGSLPKILMDPMTVYLNEKGFLSWGTPTSYTITPSDYFDTFDGQYITIIQRGVDPYSPLITNEYGLGNIFGYTNPNEIVVTGQTRLNIPIQVIDSDLSTQSFDSQDSIFYPSYFFQAGEAYSAFTTNNVGYYGSIDGDNKISNKMDGLLVNNIKYVVTKLNNPFASNSISDVSFKYDRTEDLSGVGYYYGNVTRRNNNPSNTTIEYHSPTLYPRFSSNPMQISNKNKNILRTDRLPSSDYLDGVGWDSSASLLQQNVGFSIYIVSVNTDNITIENFNFGDSTLSPDIDGQLGFNKVSNSFDCSNMVGLTCYSGSGLNFGVKNNCDDGVESGCYIFMRRPLLDLGKDLKNYSEWGFRFRFFYGICRGVLSQTFSNNWVNGVLFAFPIQIDVTFNSLNQPNTPKFCKDLIFYDKSTNNFYYRSSPYVDSERKFVGKRRFGDETTNNIRNLLFPTTIVDLGMKSQFYQEITFDRSSNYFVANKLNPTSYSDTSDLVNLFVISRIIDENFLRRILSFLSRNNSLAQLFSRKNSRVDGDLAQLLSINSEEGVIKFSPEFYASTSNAVTIERNNNKAVIGIFYSSTTEDLQFKDFLSPGRKNIRAQNNILLQLFYGNKSQEVPFYQWYLGQNSKNIFGSENNDWATDSGSIKKISYQKLDRLTKYEYFQTSNFGDNDTLLRGYIFNVDSNGNYSTTAGIYPNKFIVGAPNHFYFGLFKGKTALDKFKAKYLSDE